MTQRTVTSVTTKQPIPYSFKEITYRQFNAAIDSLEEARATVDRKERARLQEQCFSVLVENAEQLFSEAKNADVLQVLTDAIDFNQGTVADAKKSE